jgi:nucleotide-binding universal stress UspA family protein
MQAFFFADIAFNRLRLHVYTDPVGITRQESKMFKKILVPTDGSEFSHETIRRAVAFAKDTGASIIAFHAKPEPPPPHYVEGVRLDVATLSEDEDIDQRHARLALDFATKLCAESGVPCTPCASTSSVIFEAIIEAATNNGCDLIFMASHGRSGLGAVLLGSETIKVLTHSKIPVLVCRS